MDLKKLNYFFSFSWYIYQHYIICGVLSTTCCDGSSPSVFPQCSEPIPAMIWLSVFPPSWALAIAYFSPAWMHTGSFGSLAPAYFSSQHILRFLKKNFCATSYFLASFMVLVYFSINPSFILAASPLFLKQRSGVRRWEPSVPRGSKRLRFSNSKWNAFWPMYLLLTNLSWRAFQHFHF